MTKFLFSDDKNSLFWVHTMWGLSDFDREFVVCSEDHDWLNMAATFWFWHNLAVGSSHVFSRLKASCSPKCLDQHCLSIDGSKQSKSISLAHYKSDLWKGKATLCTLHNRLLSRVSIRLTNGRMRSFSADRGEMSRGWRD